MKIIFMGTPEFGVIVLEKLYGTNLKPFLVITAPDKPVGRKQIITPPPVKVIAQKYNIQVAQSEKILNQSSQQAESSAEHQALLWCSGLKSLIFNLKPDLIIVASYGQIIPKEILDIPRCGCLNVHPSLLPKYRGASPIQYAILSGDKKTGVTIMLMDEKMDHGPILAQQEWEIPNPKSQTINKSQTQNPKITYEELLKELANLGANLLIGTIPKWMQGEIKSKPQNESKATYTKILKKQDGKINWEKPAEEIERQIRAFNPWPGTYTNINLKEKEKLLKISKAHVLKQIKNDYLKPIGKIFLISNNKVAVQTKKDYLIIEELQLEGGQKMTITEFLRGHPDFIKIVVY